MTEFEQMQIEQLKRIADVLEDINGTLIGMSGDCQQRNKAHALPGKVLVHPIRAAGDQIRE